MTGSTPPTSDRSNYGIDYPFCSPSDVGGQRYISETERYVSDKGYRLGRPIPPGGIIVTCIGIIGKLGIASRAMITNQQINAVIVKPEFDVEFIFDAIGHIVPTLRTRASQQTLPILSKLEFGKVCIRIPPIPEQMKLGHFLSLLDSRIAAQRKLVELLKKHKRGLSNDLFSGKMRMVRNAKWKTYRLGDIVRRVTRKNGKVSDVPLTISAQYGLIDQREFFSKAVASADMSGYYLLKQGEFAYNRSSSGEYPFGSIKRLERYNQGAVSTLYICFEVLGDKDDAEFLKWYFDSFAWHREVGMICAEGARNHGLLNVPTDGFFDTKHILPSDKDERKNIAALMALADARCERAETELTRLTALKSGLLQQLYA